MFLYKWIIGVTLIVGVLMAPDLRAADLRAWLDRDSMQLGETVTLNVEVSGSAGSEPDFSPLQTDFDLLGTSSSSSVNIVNGQTSAKQLWAIGLQPKHAGHIAIPALKAGAANTNPLELNVAEAAAVASGHSGDDVYVEVAADPASPYVQQQVRFSVKLYYAVQLTEGALDEPRVADLVVQKLGQDRNYEAEQGGRRYKVLERRYALLPEKSGNVQIPAINFRGRALGGNDPGGSFFSRGKVVSARSQAILLSVRARPPSSTGAWLPAQSLQLDAEGVDANNSARVGEPITLTLSLRAQGLGFEQLPELELPKIEGAEVYPDKSSTRTRDDGTWLFGERSRKFAIVPKRPGKLSLPAITLSWWDTAQDRAQEASVPARDIEVAAATSADAAPTESTVPAAPGATASSTAVSPGGNSVLSNDESANPSLRFWRALAIASIGLWLICGILLFWYWRRASAPSRRRETTIVAPSTAALGSRGAFTRSLDHADAAPSARALLRWAQAEGFAVRNLGELAAQLPSPEQRAAIAQLQQACFAQEPSGILPPDLQRAFAAGLHREKPAADRKSVEALAPLWPKSTQRRA